MTGGGEGREGKGERGKEGKGEGEGREGGKVASWLLGDGRPCTVTVCYRFGASSLVMKGQWRF